MCILSWDQAESEFNKQYDPYSEKCFFCGAEECFDENIDNQTFCTACGTVMEEQ